MPRTPDRLLSVVVPFHNASFQLARCLAALVASDLDRSKWELIVVDDGSTDDSRAIAERFADRVISTGNFARGPAYARNRGVEAATAPVIAFVDADVLVHLDALSLMLSSMSSANDIVAVFGSYDDSPAEGNTISQYRNLLHHYVHHRNEGDASTFWAGCGVVNAKTFRAVGGFNEKAYPRPQIEDIELGRRLRTAGGRIVIDPRIQGTHLKAWSFVPMLRTDLFDRGIPWVRLLLSSPRDKNASTPSLGVREITGTISVAAWLFFAVAGLFWFRPYGLVAAAIFFAVSIWVNRQLYSWFARFRGAGFAARVIPLHFLYQLVSLMALPLGLILHIRDRLLKSAAKYSGGAGTSVGRFLPLASGEVGARAVAFFATAYLARRLGAGGFGEVSFAGAVVAQFGIALATGIGEIGSREVARDPSAMRRIAAAGASARLVGALIAMVAVIVLAFALPLDSGMRNVTALSSLFLVPLALNTGWVYKGLGQTRKVGISLLLSESTTLVLLLVLVHHESHVLRVPAIQALGDLAAAFFLAAPLLKGRWKLPKRDAIARMSRASGMNTISRSLRTIIVSFDVVLLGLMVSSVQVGLYSAAYRIVFFVMAIMSAAHVAFFPEMARAGNDVRLQGAVLSRTLALSLTAVTPFVVGGILIAPALMSLVFGVTYSNGAVALQLLLLSVLIIGIHGAARNFFLIMQRTGLEASIMAVGVIANIALNLMLIPRLGITGAAVATVAAEGIILILTIVALARIGIRIQLGASVAPVMAGAVLAGTILVFGRGRSVVELILIGGISYFLALAAVRRIIGRFVVPIVPEIAA
ncbi:MAG: glycosyltransferase [Gemmatimonadaceae bacterium]